MPPEQFDEMLERISQVISRQDTKFLSSLTPGLTLALTLIGIWLQGTISRHSPMRFIFVAFSTQSLSLATASL
ncbi:hypothetical protein DPMN_109841 [Dreissena polymorpha]|uniref:Uncharacterized protein n=1 Tax=Dreissena polymorpha TaxID=45954 RepID=A0A9D4KBX5_DREPO|nr:hypothetical protein DPMN_109841 [Dreissena polymorpha]